MLCCLYKMTPSCMPVYVVAMLNLRENQFSSVVPKVWDAPPIKGGARGAKLFYSLKINKKHKYN
jgi:hypothetical protein